MIFGAMQPILDALQNFHNYMQMLVVYSLLFLCKYIVSSYEGFFDAYKSYCKNYLSIQILCLIC